MKVFHQSKVKKVNIEKFLQEARSMDPASSRNNRWFWVDREEGTLSWGKKQGVATGKKGNQKLRDVIKVEHTGWGEPGLLFVTDKFFTLVRPDADPLLADLETLRNWYYGCVNMLSNKSQYDPF